MNSMKATELKNLVDTGSYKPDPSRIASAMLRRRGVRELLTGAYASPADRSHGSAQFRHRAA
jgi:Anti-sigma-28 factor, FlgM